MGLTQLLHQGFAERASELSQELTDRSMVASTIRDEIETLQSRQQSPAAKLANQIAPLYPIDQARRKIDPKNVSINHGLPMVPNSAKGGSVGDVSYIGQWEANASFRYRRDCTRLVVSLAGAQILAGDELSDRIYEKFDFNRALHQSKQGLDLTDQSGIDQYLVVCNAFREATISDDGFILSYQPFIRQGPGGLRIWANAYADMDLDEGDEEMVSKFGSKLNNYSHKSEWEANKEFFEGRAFVFSGIGNLIKKMEQKVIYAGQETLT